MVAYVEAMRTNEEWKSADARKRFFMAAAKLADGRMTKEKKAVSWYGGVRMTKAETKQMAHGEWRHQNFWIYTTVYDFTEERGGTIQKVGFKFYRDWGNGAYADLLRSIAAKALKDKTIDSNDYWLITRYSPINLGNIIETILGYGFIAKNRKDERLMEFIEIANYLENALEARSMEEDTEVSIEEMDQATAMEPKASAESMEVKNMEKNMKEMMMEMKAMKDMIESTSGDITNIMVDMDGKIDETHEEIKVKIEQGIETLNLAFDDAHEIRSRNHKAWEDECKDLRTYITREVLKRKSDAMEVDAAVEQAPAEPTVAEEDDVSDDGEKEKDLTGAQSHDMNRQAKAAIIGWLQRNPEQGKNAMMDFDRDLMNAKNIELNNPQKQLSKYIFDAVVGNVVGRNRGWTQLPREGSQALGWYPIGTIKKHLQNQTVWGTSCNDDMIWTCITETKNFQSGKTSFMIKVIRDIYVLIKARPRNWVKYQGTSAKGSTEGTDDDMDHSKWQDWEDRKKDGKKENPEAGAKSDGATQQPPHAWARDQAAKKAKEAKPPAKGEATTTTPGMVGKAPATWCVGEKTPASYSEMDVPNAWRTIQVGDKCPWTDRIARCTRDEINLSRT
jgi:hypothetical protein